ncbi:MAG TPA: proline dehydrogenase family protein, partial [Candidatus Limnocylindrales bacterium]|nr:proline dehydrogenase family protein [Candidatus Limnocylindrales bacterium]
MLRRIAVALARQSWLRKLVVSTPGVRDLAWRFVAGEDLDAGIVTLRRLAGRGVGGTLNHVGTHVHDAGEARVATDDLIVAVNRIRAEGLSASVSVKLTQIGLDVDDALCRSEFRRVLDAAAAADVFVWTDMEESPYVARTLAIFDEMRTTYGRDRVGIVLQAYLRKRAGDVEAQIQAGSRIRIVKGGYWETPDVVYRVQAEIDQAFSRVVRLLLEGGYQPAIATHDPAVINLARAIVKERAIAPGSFEFQMLYG